MKQIYNLRVLGLAATVGIAGCAYATTAATKFAACPNHPQLEKLTVLSSRRVADGISIQTLRDSKGRVFRQRVGKGQSAKPLAESPRRVRANSAPAVFYESFEGYDASLGIDWLPDGWTEINSPHHVPTEEALLHNVNNTWFTYYSSDFYQEFTPDGECEAFIHFPYDGGYGSSDDASDEWMVTPEIAIGDNQVLEFLHQGDPFTVYAYDWNTSVFDRSHVECTLKVMITDDGGQTWTQLWDYAADELGDKDDYYLYNEPQTYIRHQVSLSEYAGSDVKIAFRYVCDGGGWAGNSMMIDGVKVVAAGENPSGPAGYTYLGVGTMSDGWVIPALTPVAGSFYDPENYIFDVQVYESETTPGVFLLRSPYTSAAFPFRNLNDNTEPMDIVIDASNPAFVLVRPQDSGFVHNNPGSKAARYAAPYMISNAAAYFADDYSAEDIIENGFSSDYDAETRTITINLPQYGHVNADGTLDMGYDCSGMNFYPSIITLPEATVEAEWESIGYGAFQDGFITAGYLGNPANYLMQVEYFAKSDEPGIYLVKNPYGGSDCPLADYNLTPGQDIMIKIDASNPDIVYIEPQYSGFTSYLNEEVYPYYIGNMAGMYYSYGNPKDLIESVLEGEEIDSMTDDVITVNVPMFGSDTGMEFGYQWVNSNGIPLGFTAKFYLPTAAQPGENVGVENVMTDSGSDVRYYNLQGERLSCKPAKGLWIEVRNGKADKRMN